MALLAWIQSHLGIIVIGIVDAVLMLIPSVKSNNVVQLIVNSVKMISDALTSKITPPPAP